MRIDREQLANNIEMLYPDATIVVKQLSPHSCLISVGIDDKLTVFLLSADNSSIYTSVTQDELDIVSVIRDNLNLAGE